MKIFLSNEQLIFERIKEIRRFYGNDINKVLPKMKKKKNNEILDLIIKISKMQE